MEGQDIRGLIEAYSQVYETPEVLNEEVVEENVEQIDEIAVNFGGQAAVNKVRAQMAAQKQSDAKLAAYRAQRFGGTNPVVKAAKGGVQGTLDKTTGKFTASAKPAAAPKPAAPAAAPKPAAPAAAPKPAAPAAAPKPAATSAPKPTPAPAKPAGSAMDQWAAANPKLAAAKAERDRTRGTSATTNPLMKDMKSSLPAPKTPAPSTATTGFNLAKKGVNLAAGVDIFDLVKGHLLDEGYAETEENAIVMMANMSEEWRKSILEAHGVEKDEGGKHKEGKHPKGKEEKGEKVTEKEGKEKEDEKEMKEGLSYSAKSARAGKDIGKPGKQFEKIAKEAGERYGSKERGEKVAGAVLAKLRAKKG